MGGGCKGLLPCRVLLLNQVRVGPLPEITPLLDSASSNESESEVAQSCPTLCEPMDCCLSGSSVHGIFQARVLEWIAISFPGGSDGKASACNAGDPGRRFTV